MLRDNIDKALKDAMRAKNERAVSTLRMVNSTLKNADIEARGQNKPALGDAEVIGVLQKMVKQRQELVELYKKGGREDLVKQEEEEIAIINGYLPKQMSDDEMKAAIDGAIAETGAASMKDMGKVIGVLARQICRADGHGTRERAGEGEAAIIFLSFRGAAEGREPGIQGPSMTKPPLDSGPAAFAASRNDSSRSRRVLHPLLEQ